MARLYGREYHLVSVPEAPIHENRRSILPHHNVGFAWHALHVEAVAVAVGPQPSAHLQLGFGVLAAYVRHAAVALGGGEAVGHNQRILTTNGTSPQQRLQCGFLVSHHNNMVISNRIRQEILGVGRVGETDYQLRAAEIRICLTAK